MERCGGSSRKCGAQRREREQPRRDATAKYRQRSARTDAIAGRRRIRIPKTATARACPTWSRSVRRRRRDRRGFILHGQWSVNYCHHRGSSRRVSLRQQSEGSLRFPQSKLTTTQCCLTRRSSRAPTAWHAGHQALGLRPILRLLSDAPRCRCRLSSNVRPRNFGVGALSAPRRQSTCPRTTTLEGVDHESAGARI